MIFLSTRHLENKLLIHAHGGTQKENTTNQMTLFSTIQLLVQNRSKTHMDSAAPVQPLNRYHNEEALFQILHVWYITCRLYRYYIRGENVIHWSPLEIRDPSDTRLGQEVLHSIGQLLWVT